MQALAVSGADDWKETGVKYKEWFARKEYVYLFDAYQIDNHANPRIDRKWKAGAAERAAEARAGAQIDLTTAPNSNQPEGDSSSEGSDYESPVGQAVLAQVFNIAPGGGGGERGRNRRRRNRNRGRGHWRGNR